MRFGIKAAIMTAVAGPAIAGLMLVGAGTANAAVTTSSHTTASHGDFFNFCNQFNNPFWFREQWKLNGDNTVNATLNGSTMKFAYPVDFTQHGICLGGTLSDPYFPTSGPIHGLVIGNYVKFAFQYPAGSVQGTRTFVGHISRWGWVSGTWSETGSENATGTWSLAIRAHHACRHFFWWDPNQACFVFP
jgi:hypothetical protein